jgi:hypothetical protein
LGLPVVYWSSAFLASFQYGSYSAQDMLFEEDVITGTKAAVGIPDEPTHTNYRLSRKYLHISIVLQKICREGAQQQLDRHCSSMNAMLYWGTKKKVQPLWLTRQLYEFLGSHAGY